MRGNQVVIVCRSLVSSSSNVQFSRIPVSLSVHQGYDRFDVVFFAASRVLKDSLHAVVRSSKNSSIVYSMSPFRVTSLTSVESTSPVTS